MTRLHLVGETEGRRQNGGALLPNRRRLPLMEETDRAGKSVHCIRAAKGPPSPIHTRNRPNRPTRQETSTRNQWRIQGLAGTWPESGRRTQPIAPRLPGSKSGATRPWHSPESLEQSAPRHKTCSACSDSSNLRPSENGRLDNSTASGPQSIPSHEAG